MNQQRLRLNNGDETDTNKSKNNSGTNLNKHTKNHQMYNGPRSHGQQHQPSTRDEWPAPEDNNEQRITTTITKNKRPHSNQRQATSNSIKDHQWPTSTTIATSQHQHQHQQQKPLPPPPQQQQQQQQQRPKEACYNSGESMRRISFEENTVHCWRGNQCVTCIFPAPSLHVREAAWVTIKLETTSWLLDGFL